MHNGSGDVRSQVGRELGQSLALAQWYLPPAFSQFAADLQSVIGAPASSTDSQQ